MRPLTSSLRADWRRCISFAKEACNGRGCSHNHTHMQSVTESAVLIAMQEPSMLPKSSGADAAAPMQLHDAHMRRVIIVAALHDVNDHKYDDASGTVARSVESFVSSCFPDQPEEAKQCLEAIAAVSFSKEKKNGHRWYTTEKGGPLKEEWVSVRDIVSDADKLYAIGIEGLTRCWIFSLELIAQGKAQKLPAGAVDEQSRKILNPALCTQWATARAVEHADEKLLLLKDEYFRTEFGKELAQARHDDLLDIINDWKEGRNLPKSLDAPLHW